VWQRLQNQVSAKNKNKTVIEQGTNVKAGLWGSGLQIAFGLIIARGNKGVKVFNDDKDYRLYLRGGYMVSWRLGGWVIRAQKLRGSLG
jgi:hypothetical protein